MFKLQYSSVTTERKDQSTPPSNKSYVFSIPTCQIKFGREIARTHNRCDSAAELLVRFGNRNNIFFFPPTTFRNYPAHQRHLFKLQPRQRERKRGAGSSHTLPNTLPLRSGATEGNATCESSGDPLVYSHSHDHNRFRRCGPKSGGLCCCSCFSRSSAALKVRGSYPEVDSHLRRRGKTRWGIAVCRQSALMRPTGWIFTRDSHLDPGSRPVR